MKKIMNMIEQVCKAYGHTIITSTAVGGILAIIFRYFQTTKK